MAYQTGTSTGADDLLGIIATFAVSQGFVQEQFATISGGKWLTLSYAGMYYHFVSGDTNIDRLGADPEKKINAYLSTGYNPGAAWDAQTGMSDVASDYRRGVTNGMTGPFYAYHLFAGDDEIHCIVEITSTQFAHISFGVMQKQFGGTGGHFVTGTACSSNTWLNFPIHENSVIYVPMEYNYYYGGIPSANEHDNLDTCLRDGATIDNSTSGFMNRSYSTIDGSAALVPIYFHPQRPDGHYSLVGYLSQVRYVNNYGLQDRQEITLGSDTWIVFPMTEKASNVNQYLSGSYGLAYKKVV